ncbi:PEP-CTERM sorting domain-containing protein [Planctomycetota bacterium]|nr:PEP-CTERM sorting domain-containing protein [Planctomycetota bacterium]
MKRILTGAAAFALTLPLLTQANAATVTGELIANSDFAGADNTERYEGWTTNGIWRPGGNKEQLTTDLKTDGNAGYFNANTIAITLTDDIAITSTPDYDPTTAMLTDITINNPSVKSSGILKAGANLSAEIYVEIDINTVGGDQYRVSSTHIPISQGNFPANGTLTLNDTTTWATYSTFDGDPFTGTSGIALSNIDEIKYKWVMRVIAPNTDGTGTVFVSLDDASATYTVDIPAIPEPASLALISLGGLLTLSRRRS